LLLAFDLKLVLELFMGCSFPQLGRCLIGVIDLCPTRDSLVCDPEYREVGTEFFFLPIDCDDY
jgi:hypothetical protein